MVKIKSPNYPSIDLGDAIARVKLVYASEHKHATSREAIAKAMGFNTLNGHSRMVISTLVKYGLLEAVGESQCRVSEAAENIISLPEADPRRAEAIKTAAFKPSLFAELHKAYADKIPSDETLKFLLVKKNFNPKTISEVIATYRKTVEFVGQGTSKGVHGSELTNRSESHEVENAVAVELRAADAAAGDLSHTDAEVPGTGDGDSTIETEMNGSAERLRFLIAQNCHAEVSFDVQPTQAAIRKLIQHLELEMADFPVKSQHMSAEIDDAERAQVAADEPAFTAKSLDGEQKAPHDAADEDGAQGTLLDQPELAYT